jgi:hypothetical protein
MQDKDLQATKELMAALGRMKPKPHEEIRVNPKGKKAKRPAKKRASAKR